MKHSVCVNPAPHTLTQSTDPARFQREYYLSEGDDCTQSTCSQRAIHFDENPTWDKVWAKQEQSYFPTHKWSYGQNRESLWGLEKCNKKPFCECSHLWNFKRTSCKQDGGEQILSHSSNTPLLPFIFVFLHFSLCFASHSLTRPSYSPSSPFCVLLSHLSLHGSISSSLPRSSLPPVACSQSTLLTLMPCFYLHHWNTTEVLS